MKKLLFLYIFILLSLTTLYAQQQYYNWYITAGGGAMAYYGDLSYKLSAAKINVPAYQLSIGRIISPSLALTLQGSYGQISANDRATDWNGTLRTDNENFSRGLNFQTNISNVNLLLNYRLNNGSVLSKHAAIAPYLYSGIGLTHFAVYGDLYNMDGQRYYYWSDNTIRNQLEQPATTGTAQIIVQDRNFETKLSGLATEQTYPTTVVSVPAGAGLRIRLSDRFSANVQMGANFAFTGYLDDVNGAYKNEYTSPEQAYAANPTGIKRDMRGNQNNDIYLNAFLSVAYHFNFKKNSFSAPMVYTGYQSTGPVAYQDSVAYRDSDAEAAEFNQIETPSLEISEKPVSLKDSLGRRIENVTVDSGKPILSGNETDTLQGIDNPLALQNIAADKTDTIDVTSPEKILPQQRVTSSPADSLAEPAIQPRQQSPVKQAPVETVVQQKTEISPSMPDDDGNLQNSVAALQQDMNALRAEINSLRSENNSKEVEVNKPASKQKAMADTNATTASHRIISPERQVQVQSPLPDNPELAALREEVKMLREELNLEKSRNVRQIPQDVAVRADRGKNTDTGLTLSTKPENGRRYNTAEMKVLDKELQTIKAQLSKLQTQNKVSSDTIVNNKIDSLLTLIDTIRRFDTTRINDSAQPIDTVARAQQSQLIDSLQNQVTQMSTSLQKMYTNFSEDIDSLSAGVPFSALGSTVVYYDTNKSALDESDKQRLAVMGRRMQSNPSVILHIKGFADQTGNAAYNLALSRKRAEAVKNYFVKEMNIPSSQILINYFGGQKAPSDKNSPYDRRVELELFREQ